MWKRRENKILEEELEGVVRNLGYCSVKDQLEHKKDLLKTGLGILDL